MDYFQLFGLEPSFNLDTERLSSSYQRLQKSVHPDRFAHASSQQQLLAVQKSSQINDGYQTLKNPLTRAGYMLTLRGTVLPNEQASFADSHFLMRQMELREMLEELGDAADPDAALLEVSETLDSEYQHLFNALTQQIAADTPADNEAAGETLRKLKFYQKLQLELERIEEQLFDD